MAPAPSNQRRGQGVTEVLRHCHRGAICGVVTPVPEDQIGRRRGGKQSLKIAQIAAAVGVAKKDPLDVGGKILQASPTRATVTAPRLTDHLRTAEACTWRLALLSTRRSLVAITLIGSKSAKRFTYSR